MWPNPQFAADLVAFTEEIFDGKLYILRSVKHVKYCIQLLAINVFISWYISSLLIAFFCLFLFCFFSTCLLLICPVNATMVCTRISFAFWHLQITCRSCILYDLEPDLGQWRPPSLSSSYAPQSKKIFVKHL